MRKAAHTGEVDGIFGRTIAGLAFFSATVLVYSGFALAIRRLYNWRERRVRQAVAAGSAD